MDQHASQFDFLKDCPNAVIICDREGTIVYMNDASAAFNAERGGYNLLGRNMYLCHGPKESAKARHMIASGEALVSFPNPGPGEKFIVQAMPWMDKGVVAGLIEMLILIPQDANLQLPPRGGQKWHYWLPKGFDAASFQVNAAKVKTIDIRAACNRSFEQIANDGAEGLVNMPDGLLPLRGVLFDIIHGVDNNNAACIVLGNSGGPHAPREVVGIPVGEPFKALYLVHTAVAGSHGAEVFSYRIRYADGSAALVPVVVGVNTGDYQMGGDAGQARVAWRSWGQKAIYVWRWENPGPHKTIAAIDIVSAATDAVPVVVAITGEHD